MIIFTILLIIGFIRGARLKSGKVTVHPALIPPLPDRMCVLAGGLVESYRIVSLASSSGPPFKSSEGLIHLSDFREYGVGERPKYYRLMI